MLDSFKVPQPTQSPNHSFHVAAHTNMHPFNRPLSGTTWVSRYQKGKTNLHFTEARDSGSGISWAICKSAAHSRQITMPALHHSSFFTGWMPFVPPNQQRQSTEGISCGCNKSKNFKYRMTGAVPVVGNFLLAKPCSTSTTLDTSQHCLMLNFSKHHSCSYL